MSNDFDLQLPAGRLRARRHGSASAPLVLCVPGLSANLTSYDRLGETLANDRLQLVALDLRGRGCSEVTPPGTYGWHRHAQDVFDAATALGARRFTLIGHSMGGAIAKAAAHQHAARLERVVLLDHCGIPEASSLGAIAASVSRLGTVYESAEAYLAMVRGLGVIQPWSEHWERYFRYELREVDGGVASRTDRAAVFEDGAFGGGCYAFGRDATVYRLWHALTMPALLLRAAREILPGLGYIVSADDAARFERELPAARVRAVDANHYTVITSDESAAAIAEFLSET